MGSLLPPKVNTAQPRRNVDVINDVFKLFLTFAVLLHLIIIIIILPILISKFKMAKGVPEKNARGTNR